MNASSQFLTLILLSFFSIFSQAQPRADLIFVNGAIWTIDDKNPTAQAVAIKDGKFMAVGKNTEILKLRGRQTQVIDLRGRFVVPGFNDNHVHFASAAQFLEFNIMSVASQEEFGQRVKQVISTLPKGEWIVGGFWGAYDQWAAGTAGGPASQDSPPAKETLFRRAGAHQAGFKERKKKREPFVPEMKRIELLTKDYPMFIRKFNDTEFAANTAAFKAAGLHPTNPQASDVEFLQDGKGNVTGLMRGKGVMPLFRNVIPHTFSHERRVQQTKRALEEIRKHGVTNVSDMSDDEQLEIYRELHAKGELTCRIHFRYGLDRWKEMAEMGIKVGLGDAWIRLGALKGHIDGIVGTSTARFFEPYFNNPTNRGRWRSLMVDSLGNFAEGKFLGYMLDADRAGLQITVHAIGDEANNVLLNYLEELTKQNGKKDRRFRLVHAQVIAPNDFKRLGELGVVAEVQPFHLSDDMRWMEERIGHERSKGAYAFKSIMQSGAVLCFGTDWPGTSASEYPINPMLGLYAAVTRQTIKGEPKEGWFPEERISIEEAIKAYTLNTAYANFEEDLKGSIKVGKLADLVVLSKNILTIPPAEIVKTEVLYTIVDGKIVYKK